MEWFINEIIKDYGKEKWAAMSENQRTLALATFGKNLIDAVKYLKKVNKKERDKKLHLKRNPPQIPVHQQ